MAQPTRWDEAAARLGLAYEPGSWARRHRLFGTLGGLAVEVANGDAEYGDTTDYTVVFPPLGLGLSLRRGGPLRAPGRRLRGELPSGVTGNPEFDRAVLVKCTDPDRLALFLDAGRQAVVLRLFEEYPGVRILDDRIRWSSQRLDPPDRIETALRALVEAATALRR